MNANDWIEFYKSQTRDYGARAAHPSLWKTRPAPPPSLRADLRYKATYTREQYEVLKHGFVPCDMDQRWFVVFVRDRRDERTGDKPKGGDGGWLKLYRSWTGDHIYALHLVPSTEGWTVDQSWVARDPPSPSSPSHNSHNSRSRRPHESRHSHKNSKKEDERKKQEEEGQMMQYERESLEGVLEDWCFEQHRKWLELKAEDERKARAASRGGARGGGGGGRREGRGGGQGGARGGERGGGSGRSEGSRGGSRGESRGASRKPSHASHGASRGGASGAPRGRGQSGATK